MLRKIWLSIFTLFCMYFFISGVDAKSLSDGVYEIHSFLNDNLVLNVQDGNLSSGGNVQLWNNNKSDSQKWEIKYLGNDCYSIESKFSNNLVLDTAGGSKTNGTNIQLWNSNKTDSQKWLLKAVGNGYYSIISKNSGLYVDVSSGSAISGANIQIWRGNNSNAQKFKFVEVFETPDTPLLEDGTYTISSFVNHSKVLNVSDFGLSSGTPMQLYDYNKSAGQFWNVKNLGTGYYKIVSYWDNQKAFDIKNGYVVSGSSVQIWNDNGSDAQQWIIKSTGDGYFNIVSKTNSLYLDISAGSMANGTKIQLWNNNGSDAQKFKFNKITSLKKLEDGYYTINSLLDSSKVLGVDSNVTHNQANVVLKNKDDLNTSKWYVEHLTGAYYGIKTAANRRLSLDVASGISSAGANIQLWGSNKSNAQTWIIQDNLDGTYTIVSKIGRVLDVSMGKAVNKANIQLWNSNGSNAQKWTFIPSNFSDTAPLFDDGYYTINSALDEQMVLDVSSALKFNGTNVQLWGSNKSNAQIWHLERLSDDYYTITSAMNPRLSLDVANGSGVNFANVQIYRTNNSMAQQWLLKTDEDGYITFISRGSGNALEVADSNPVAGANIRMAFSTKTKNQKFELKPYTEKKVYKGIDVSHHNKDIDWQKVANSGIDFVMIRAGYGGISVTDQDDKKFMDNVAACEKYNIPYGLYLYSYALDAGVSAISEADHMLNLIVKIGAKNYKPNLGTSVYLDMEDADNYKLNHGMPSGSTLTNICNTFCDKIESNGYKCGIYASSSWLNDKVKKLDGISLANKYDIWVAQWPNGKYNFDDAKKMSPSFPYYKLWQFASDGSISGINGRVDLDLGYDIFDDKIN